MRSKIIRYMLLLMAMMVASCGLVSQEYKTKILKMSDGELINCYLMANEKLKFLDEERHYGGDGELWNDSLDSNDRYRSNFRIQENQRLYGARGVCSNKVSLIGEVRALSKEVKRRKIDPSQLSN